jgi:chaperonin GroEL
MPAVRRQLAGQELTMGPKQLVFHDAARARLWRGVEALADAVKVTLGPRGRTVILERDAGSPQIVNSGVLVAKSIELEDRFENMGAQLLREVAARTSEMAGDDTTTATVLAHVAAISANNDRSIGDLLARAIDKVGREGAISIEDGSGLESLLEVVEGLQFDRGFLSPYFINNAERQSAVLEDVSILLCEGRLSSLKDLVPLLEAMVQDIAVLTGGSVVSDEVGLTLGKVKLSHLGHATRAEITHDTTTLIGGAGQPQAIQARIASLRKERERAVSDYDKEKLDERAAKLPGGVALLRARRALRHVTTHSLDESAGIALVAHAPQPAGHTAALSPQDSPPMF